jgi:hypothetical protein
MINAKNESNGLTEMKYGTVRLKEDTYKRLYRYISKRALEKSGRVTADEAVSELLDAKGAE